jgi:hypothetical protein
MPEEKARRGAAFCRVSLRPALILHGSYFDLAFLQERIVTIYVNRLEKRTRKSVFDSSLLLGF